MKVQTPETLWGVIKLYLTLSLFALPLGYALDLKWNHLLEGSHYNPHIIGLAIALGLTAKQILQIGRDYNNIAQEKGDTLPKKPHPTDQPMDDYLLDLFNSPFFEYKFLENEQMTDFVKRTLAADNWVVPEKLDLTRKHRQGLAKRILLSYERFASTLNILHKQTERLEKITTDWTRPFQDIFGDEPTNPTEALQYLEGYRKSNNDKDRQLGIQSTELTRLQGMLQRWQSLALMFPGSSDDFQDVRRRITTALDLTPIINLLQEDSRPKAPTPEKLAKVIDSALEGLRGDIAAIAGGTPPPTQDIQQTIKWVSRRVKGISSMSGVQPTPSGLDQSDSDALDSTIDKKYVKPHQGTGYTPQQLQEIIEEMQGDLNTLGKKPKQTITSCTHPEDLSTILIGDDTQDWPDSLQQVQDLITATRRPAPTGSTQTERLFSSNDVPKLTDEDDYWTYRRSFEIFASAVTVTPTDIPVAISRILNRYEGRRRDYMMAYDVGNNIKPTWTPTWRAILHYMDARFLDRDAHLELFKKWITLRPNDKLWGQSFIAEFDRLRMTLNQIAVPQRKTVISNDKSLERLIDKLPTKVRNAFRYNHPNAEYQLMDATDTTTLENIYDWIIDDWKFLRSQGDLGTTKEKDTKKTGGSHSGTPAQNKPSTPRVHPIWGTCNKPCWDEETVIPNGYRGKYMNIARGKDLICPHCRRRKEEHGGHPTGCQHHGEHRFHGPNSNSSDPSGNAPGDQ